MARRTFIPEGKTGERGNAKHAHTSVNPRHAPRPTPPAHNSEHPTPRTQRSTTQHRASRAQPISAQCCKGPPAQTPRQHPTSAAPARVFAHGRPPPAKADKAELRAAPSCGFSADVPSRFPRLLPPGQSGALLLQAAQVVRCGVTCFIGRYRILAVCHWEGPRIGI